MTAAERRLAPGAPAVSAFLVALVEAGALDDDELLAEADRIKIRTTHPGAVAWFQAVDDEFEHRTDPKAVGRCRGCHESIHDDETSTLDAERGIRSSICGYTPSGYHELDR